MRTQFILFLALVFGLQGAKAQVVLQALDAPNFNIPPTVTLSGGERYFASVYDNNYLPFSFPIIGAATWNTNVNPDGTLDTLTDYQGVITTTGTTVDIPITATGNGILPAATFTTVVPAAHTEDGVSRTLELSWQNTPYTSTTTAITATVKSIGGVLNIKKLDLNAGIGSDKKGVVLATFNYPGNATNEMRAFILRVLPGIPDRCFGKTTQQCLLDMGSFSPWASTEVEHQFIYLPIKGPDGRTWLNNNLGAEYARIDSPDFNPTQQATSKRDYKAYGSLFQWQRKPDGHELINWTSSNSGTPKYTGTGATTSWWIDAGTNLFITNAVPDYSWVANPYNRQPSMHQLWRANGENNPCPVGYHVPTHAEIKALHDAVLGYNAGTDLIYSNAMMNDTIYRLTIVDQRDWGTGAITNYDYSGNYWASDPGVNNRAKGLGFNDVSSSVGATAARAVGMSVRCIQD